MTVSRAKKDARRRMFVASGRRMPRLLWLRDSPNLHVRITVRGHEQRTGGQR